MEESEAVVEEDPPAEPIAETPNETVAEEEVNAGDELELTPLPTTPVSSDDSDTTDISESELTPLAPLEVENDGEEEQAPLEVESDEEEEQTCDTLKNWTAD